MPDKPTDPGALQHLGEELYRRDESAVLTSRSEATKRMGYPEFTTKNVATPAAGEAMTATRFTGRPARWWRTSRVWKWVAIVGGISVLVVLLIGGSWWYRTRTTVTDDQIQVTITGPQAIQAGEEVTLQIKYANHSYVDWQNVEVVIRPATGFTLASSAPPLQGRGREYLATLGDLAAQQTGTIELKGTMVGEQNATIPTEVELFFTPTNFPSGRFSKSFIHTATITSLSLDVALDAPKDAAVGERIVVTLQAHNVGRTVVHNAYLKLTTPAGIQLATEDPAFSPDFSAVDSRWVVSELQPLASVTRTVVLYLTGQPGEQRQLAVEAGLIVGETALSQRSVSHVFAISASELSITQTYNGATGTVIVTPGQAVAAKVAYHNTGTVPLTNAVVSVQFEGTGLDPATVKLPKGTFTAKERTMTWTGASVPELKVIQPQQKGELTFTFKILPIDSFPKDGPVVANFALVSTAAIDSPDLPAPVGTERKVISDRLVLPIETQLHVGVDAFYDDGRLGLPSSGPLPPKVGEETSYTVRLRLSSTLNDVGAARVVMIVPEGVTYTDRTYITGGSVQFEERTGEVVWTIPLVEGGAGRRSPSPELHVQVAITPGPHQRGGSLPFARKITAEGTDQFTERTLTAEVPGIDVPTTQSANTAKGTVQ